MFRDRSNNLTKPGRHARVLKSIERTELLILDDWGLAVLTAPERRDLLEILEDRCARVIGHWPIVTGG